MAFGGTRCNLFTFIYNSGFWRCKESFMLVVVWFCFMVLIRCYWSIQRLRSLDRSSRATNLRDVVQRSVHFSPSHSIVIPGRSVLSQQPITERLAWSINGRSINCANGPVQIVCSLRDGTYVFVQSAGYYIHF